MKAFAFSLLVLLLSTLAYAGEAVLYSFQGGADGDEPFGGLVLDAAGNLYGTTAYGGDVSCNPPTGCGTVFELSPDGLGGWTKTTLYTFAGGADGQGPGSTLVLDDKGNLYGTTGGTGSPPKCGSVFELSPGGTGWTFALLHAFKCKNDGGDTGSGIVRDSAGNLYGVTGHFGPAGYGTTYQLSNTGNGWKLKTLIAFDLYAKGGGPSGPLVLASNGTIYGVTEYGGNNNGAGVLYSLSKKADGNWKEKVLRIFTAGGDVKDCSNPVFGLSSDQDGNLYCSSDVNNRQWGRLFKFVKNAHGQWTKQTIYSFGPPHGNKGSVPAATVLVDSSGNIYGTTASGGGGGGTVYELIPQLDGKYSGTVLYGFGSRENDGVTPWAPVIMDANGNLYGVTTQGGLNNGTVFEITP